MMELHNLKYMNSSNEEQDSLSVFIKGNSSFTLGGFTLRPSFVDPKLDNQNIEIDSITGTNNNFFNSPNPNNGMISGFSKSGVSYSRENKDGEWLEIARYKFNQIIQDDIQVTTDDGVADFFLSDGTNINIPSDTKNISVINSYVNDGVATFSIKGTAEVGNTLSISEDAADPDGVGTLSYS